MCGACTVQERRNAVLCDPKIVVHTGTQIRAISKSSRFDVTLDPVPVRIDVEKCTLCGACLKECPVGAIVQGNREYNRAVYAVSDACRYSEDRSCQNCLKACPEDAVILDDTDKQTSTLADAIILATGFEPYNPEDRPYGYALFENIVTTADLEDILTQRGEVCRPSDHNPPKTIAFIQCVGSRDFSLNHLWCSRVCCASALRTAGLVLENRPGTRVTIFYIDIQTDDRGLADLYGKLKNEIRFIRTLPGDIYEENDNTLRITYYDTGLFEAVEEVFDLVVLSVGLLPSKGLGQVARLFGVQLDDSGFIKVNQENTSTETEGVFAIGACRGPAGIAESIGQAEQAAWESVKYLASVRP